MNFFKAPTYTRYQLEQLDESQISFPFSDEDAVYDGETHRYILTDKYFLQRGVNLQEVLEGNDPEKVKHFLKDLSTKVYLYVYSHNMQTPRPVMNYIIAKRGITGYTPYEYRQAFLEAMFIEGQYLATNGDISQVTGVDLDTMQNMSEDVIRNQERDFHKDAVLALRQLGLVFYGKYRILVQGKQGVNW